MDNLKNFKDLLESITDFRKIVFLIILIKKNNDLLKKCGCLKTDFKLLCKAF